MKQKAGQGYRVECRTTKKRGTGPLSGYAIDVTIRVNGGEAYFLQDHNTVNGNVMPHNNREELIKTLLDELERNHLEHFGHL
jgi:hypothetical protein